MAAFNFPDPLLQKTVTNPITGSTYQWKEPPGKWVIVTKVRAVTDIIWEGDSPPDPVGDYKLWYSTDTLELYFYSTDANGTSAWVPTSTPITMLEDLEEDVRIALQKSGAAVAAANNNLNAIGLLDTALEEVENSLGKVTLEEVLNNGNVADKGFVLTNLENDAILVSPEQGRIMAAGVGDVIPRYELRHVTDDGFLDTSLVELELDENGERFDIECDEKVDNIHFRFNNDVKLELNKKGDAVFNGKVKVEPGTVGNEVVTFGQLATVAEEIEQLAPSYERGVYNISTQEVTSSSSNNGKYNLVRKNNSADNNAARRACEDAREVCKRNPNNDPIDCENQYMQCESQIPAVGSVDKYITKFSEVEQIKFSKFDANGEEHTWDGVLIGQLIDVFNDNDDNYMVGRITAIEGTTVKTFTVDVLSSKGNASGSARVKIFTLNESVDVSNFVRKTGDTMTGTLHLKSDTYSSGGAAYPKVRFTAPTSNGDGTTDIALHLDGAYLNVNNNFKTVGSLSAKGNLQYNGETRVGMSADGGYLGKGTAGGKRALEWDTNGIIDRIQVNNGIGETGQVLVKKGDKKIQWASPQVDIAKTPSPFMWYWEKKPGSEIANPKHFWWEGGKFLYFSSTTATGMILSKPDNLPSGAQRFLSYSSQTLARHLKLWKQSSGGSWELMAWAVPYKYRFNYGGWVQLEYMYREGSFPDITGSLWAVSCPDIF